ncbi:MAG: PilN domain-containing protein [Chromatiales bacterium]|jgi:type IV pilus assembly protein PilN|nr:PilN domain-containing protein [Chromatiales bacterium]MDX9767357.1 PilN domain-containing protein [Ectothiorhodospiraceae bacterium]
MSRINLLPWRDALRKERQQRFLIQLGVTIAVACLAMLYVHFHMEGLIEHQQDRNRFLDNEIKILDRQIAEIQKLDATKKALIERMKIIEQLQTSRPLAVHLLDKLVTTLPDGMVLNTVSQRGAALTITGRAESNARVSAYMRSLEASGWFSGARLTVIEATEVRGARISNFTLTVTQTTGPRG